MYLKLTHDELTKGGNTFLSLIVVCIHRAAPHSATITNLYLQRQQFPGLVFLDQVTKEDGVKSLFVSHKLLRFCRGKLDPLIGVAFCYHWSSVRPVASDCQVNFPRRSISPSKRLSDFPFRTSNDTPLKAGTIRFPAHRAVTKDNSGEASVLRVWNKIAGAAFPPFPSEILDTRGFTVKWSEVGAVRRELCGGWVSWGGIGATLMLTGILPVARPFFFSFLH